MQNMSVSMATQVSVRLDDDLEQDLDEFIERHGPFEPNKSDVVRKALREYLDRELGQN